MSKKDLAAVSANLADLAGTLPTQNTSPQRPAKPVATVVEDEPVVQFSMGLRKSLRKQLARLADDEDMTMRAFVLMALKEKGLEVEETDLWDLRKIR